MSPARMARTTWSPAPRTVSPCGMANPSAPAWCTRSSRYSPGRDMSEREEFLELEKEREAFERFYEKNWKSARKKIRKRILWGRK